MILLPLFYQPFPFYGKNLNPPFFRKIWKLKPPPLLYKVGGAGSGSEGVPTMESLKTEGMLQVEKCWFFRKLSKAFITSARLTNRFVNVGGAENKSSQKTIMACELRSPKITSHDHLYSWNPSVKEKKGGVRNFP